MIMITGLLAQVFRKLFLNGNTSRFTPGRIRLKMCVEMKEQAQALPFTRLSSSDFWFSASQTRIFGGPGLGLGFNKLMEVSGLHFKTWVSASRILPFYTPIDPFPKFHPDFAFTFRLITKINWMFNWKKLLNLVPFFVAVLLAWNGSAACQWRREINFQG